MDILQQMINDAETDDSFRAAAMMVGSHVRAGRNPDSTHALMVGLSLRGHYLISRGGNAPVISRAVMDVLAAEPHRNQKLSVAGDRVEA